MDKNEKYLARLIDFENFLDLFWSFCKEYDTHERAYEATERQFISFFGKRRYSDYQSFRQVRDRFLKKKCAKL